jgi:3-oxoacyl-[acyl-carrier protein] reductase
MIATGDSLKGKVVIVTGSGAGVGRGVSIACARQGAAVVVTSRYANGHDVVAEIKAEGGEAVWARCDVTIRSEVEQSVAVAVKEFGGLDAMIHNAVSNRSSEVHKIEEVGVPLWWEHVSVSLRGAYYCGQAAFAELQKRKGRYILFTSPAGMEGAWPLPAYGTVKGALRGLGKSLALEWGPLGVSVALISPLAHTPALDNAYIENPELEARLKALVPLGRVGDPATDIGPAVAFLVGEAAQYINGQTLVIDGGRFTTL